MLVDVFFWRERDAALLKFCGRVVGVSFVNVVLVWEGENEDGLMGTTKVMLTEGGNWDGFRLMGTTTTVAGSLLIGGLVGSCSWYRWRFGSSTELISNYLDNPKIKDAGICSFRPISIHFPFNSEPQQLFYVV